MFTCSHDGTLRVWDITGITTETAFGGRAPPPKPVKDQKEIENQTNNKNAENNQNNTANAAPAKIMIGDDD